MRIFLSHRQSKRWWFLLMVMAVWIVRSGGPLLAFNFHPLDTQTLDLKVTGNAGEMFDDNVTFVKKNKKTDLITELLAAIEASYRGIRHQWDLALQTKQQLFASHQDFNNNAQDVNFHYSFDRSKKDRLSLSNLFSHYEDPRSFEEQFGRSEGRYSYLTDSALAEYSRELNERWSMTVDAGGGIHQISRKDLPDSYEITGLAGTEYKLSSKLSFKTQYDYGFRDFSNGPNASIQTLTGGARYFLTERLYAEALGGGQLSDSFQNKTEMSPAYSFSLNQKVDQKSVAALLFESRTMTTPFSMSLFEQKRVSLKLTRQIWKRLSGALAAFWGRGKYSAQDLKEDLWGVGGSLIYELSDRWKLMLSYFFSMSDAHQEDSGYEKNVAGLRLSYDF